MKSRIALLVALSVLLMVPVAAQAGEMVLQAQPKATAEAAASSDLCDIFTVCSLWHEESPEYCNIWHVIYCGPIESINSSNDLAEKALGRKLTLESSSEIRQVKIQRLVPQYHLASGVVVEPQGEWNPRNPGGEEWRQVGSLTKRSFQVANWDDVNADGQVGVGDRIIFKDGRQSRIKAVRLGVHVEVTQTQPRQ